MVLGRNLQNDPLDCVCASGTKPAASPAERVYRRRDLAAPPEARSVLALDRNQSNGPLARHALPPTVIETPAEHLRAVWTSRHNRRGGPYQLWIEASFRHSRFARVTQNIHQREPEPTLPGALPGRATRLPSQTDRRFQVPPAGSLPPINSSTARALAASSGGQRGDADAGADKQLVPKSWEETGDIKAREARTKETSRIVNDGGVSGVTQD